MKITTGLALLLSVALSGQSLAQRTESVEPGRVLDRNGVVLVGNDTGMPSNRVFPFGAAAAHVTRGFTLQRKGNKVNAKIAGGEDLYLTIDIRMQLAAEKALRKVVRGAAVVINPETGEILAMASVPSFDPAIFVPSIKEADWLELAKDEGRPLLNRAHVAQYPPGSVFKVVSALAAPSPKRPLYDCTGRVTYGKQPFHCWKRGGHGELDLQGALCHSCNLYFSDLGNQVGVDEIGRVAGLLGFGAQTGIPVEHEAAGYVPSKGTSKERFGIEWGESQNASLANGQGFVLSTPLQLAGAMSGLANNGTYVSPILILGSKPDKVDLLKNKVSAESIAAVRQGMWDVVNKPEGTGRHARIEGQKIYGKTGTSQWKVNEPGNYLSSFAGFTGDPGDAEPRFAIAVVVENSKSGGMICAPLARMVLGDCLAMPIKVDPKKVPAKRLEPAKGTDAHIKEIKE